MRSERFLVFIPFTLVLLIFAPVVLQQTHGDAFQFWYAGHLAASRISVYDQVAWYEASARYGSLATDVAINCPTPDASDCLWLYPPWTAFAFVPFGILPPEIGIPIIRALVVLATVGALLLSVRFVSWRSSTAPGLALAIVAALEPVQLALTNSQFDAVLVIAAFLAWRVLRQTRDYPIVLAVLATALKPHLMLAVVPLVAGRLAKLGRLRALVLGLVVSAGLVVLGFALDPPPLAALLQRSGSKAAANNATVWALGELVLPSRGLIVAIGLLAIACLALVVAVRNADLDRDAVLVAGGLALSRAIAPYAHTYDDLLLVPAIVLIVAFADRSAPIIRAAILVAIISVVLVFSWGAYLLVTGAGPQAVSSLVSVLVLCILGLAAIDVRPRREMA
jgi:glycosyl transferase family 87